MSALVRIACLGRPVSGRLALAVLAGVGAAGSAVGLIATSAWLISRAAEQPPVLYLMVAVTAVRAFGIGRGVLRYAERLLAHDAALRVLAELRGVSYARLERLAPAGLADFRSGDLVARLVLDVDGLADLWLRVLVPCAEVVLVCVAAATLVGVLVPSAGAVLAASLLVAGAVAPLAVGAVTRGAERRIAPERGALAAGAMELLAGAPELLAAGATAGRVQELTVLDRRLAAAEAGSARGAAAGALLAGLASGAATWFALVAGAAAVRDGALDRVMLAVVVLVPAAAHEVSSGLSPALRRLPHLGASAARVHEMLERPDPVHPPARPVPLPAGPYGIRVRGLRAAYDPTGPEVLTGLDLELAPGERALVTGPSGSGKSTLAAILLRFLEPTGGTIELVCPGDAVHLSALAEADVRQVICLCEQEPHVFDTTLAANVRLARPGASDAEVRDALRSAQLLTWADGLPEGIQTLTGEHGARLSAGQRQRLALARALLADPSILVLDEPTEHLDEETAAALVRDMLDATAGRTLIVLTHRPELMAAAGWSQSLALGERGTAPVGKGVSRPASAPACHAPSSRPGAPTPREVPAAGHPAPA